MSKKKPITRSKGARKAQRKPKKDRKVVLVEDPKTGLLKRMVRDEKTGALVPWRLGDQSRHMPKRGAPSLFELTGENRVSPQIVDSSTKQVYRSPVAEDLGQKSPINRGVFNTLDELTVPEACKRLVYAISHTDFGVSTLQRIRDAVDARLAEKLGSSANAPPKSEKKGVGRQLDMTHAKVTLAAAQSVSALTVRSKMRLAVSQSGMTLEQVGVKMGYSAADARQEVSRLIDTKVALDPRVDTVIAFAHALQCSPSYFLSLDANQL
jgi:hypothetical protein